MLFNISYFIVTPINTTATKVVDSDTNYSQRETGDNSIIWSIKWGWSINEQSVYELGVVVMMHHIQW